MFWQAASADHIGGRSEQQDRVGIWHNALHNRYLLVVADGMGGHKGGALAAQAVIDTAEQAWQSHQHNDQIESPCAFLSNLCIKAHKQIQITGERLGLEPHSTCVMLYIQDQQAYYTHLGDSRLYQFRDNQCLQRSHDHSIVQMLLDMGRISEEEMGSHPDQGCLLKGLGGNEDPDLSCEVLDLCEGDSFLLCSDGLWEQIQVEEMASTLSAADLLQSAEDLVELAVNRAGQTSDNVTVALLSMQKV